MKCLAITRFLQRHPQIAGLGVEHFRPFSHLFTMPQVATSRHYSTRRAEVGHYLPRRFSSRSRHRFDVARRRAYLSRLPAAPSAWQASTIDALIAIEWAALEAESRLGDTAAAREAREHRRLLMRLMSDFERSLTASAPPSRRLSLAERILAEQAGG